MTELAVALLTLGLVCACAVRGHAQGWRRAGRGVLRRVLPAAAAAALLGAGMTARWFWPFGLATPWIAAGLLLVGGAWALGRWLPQRDEAPGRGERWLGAAVGALVGTACAASFWLVLLVMAGGAAADSETARAGERRWLEALATTANRGFVRHLPVVGPLGDELEALLVVLNADGDAHRALARAHDWERLAGLPVVQDALVDDEVGRELDAVRGGSLLALYRLQRHPAVLALFESDAVMRRVEGLRPSHLAAALDAAGRSARGGALRAVDQDLRSARSRDLAPDTAQPRAESR